MKKSIKYGLLGAAAGAAYSIVSAPQRIAFALTAPVSYPLIGLVSMQYSFAITEGMENVPKPIRAFGPAILGPVVGVAMVPAAPLTIICEPLQVPVGALAGGAIGAWLGHEADNGTPASVNITNALESLEELMTPPNAKAARQQAWADALRDAAQHIGDVLKEDETHPVH